MTAQIQGLHHVTSIASDARAVDRFFTGPLGLRRVKKTVNFDSPDTYHLYYGDGAGSPGSVMTYFPFGRAARGTRGAGEVGTTAFAIPEGTAHAWADRLAAHGVKGLTHQTRFGARRLSFDGPDGDGLALVETPEDDRTPWAADVPEAMALRGFHSVEMTLRDTGATEELLTFLGYERAEAEDGVTRLIVPGGNGADAVDLRAAPDASHARQSAGSIHHVAFSVPDRDAQLAVRERLMDTGYQVTPVIDRDYFWAIYFRTPGGILFEVATDGPGFDRDEDPAHLGEALKLPSQHEHLRAAIERHLEPLE
ncbi:MAG: ring-cleaving dioxygenase [Paracoccaceae bacterium]